MGKDIERIYQRFEDANDFTGSDRRKRYGKEEYRALEEYFMRHYPGNSVSCWTRSMRALRRLWKKHFWTDSVLG